MEDREWHTEVKEIFDLKKAYFAYKKGEELGSEFSANRRLAILMDYEVEIPQDEVDEFIQKNAFKLNDKNYFKSADFYDYLVQGYLSGSASFTQNDDLYANMLQMEFFLIQLITFRSFGMDGAYLSMIDPALKHLQKTICKMFHRQDQVRQVFTCLFIIKN